MLSPTRLSFVVLQTLQIVSNFLREDVIPTFKSVLFLRWTKLLQDLGPDSKSRGWAERGKLLRWEGLPSSQEKPKMPPLISSWMEPCPFPGIGHTLLSLQYKDMRPMPMSPQPMPFPHCRRQLWFFSAYSTFCVCSLNFSPWYLPLTSANPAPLNPGRLASGCLLLIHAKALALPKPQMLS